MTAIRQLWEWEHSLSSREALTGGNCSGEFYTKVIYSLAGSLDNELMERRRNHLNIWKDTWIDRFLDLPCKGRAILVGLVVAVLGIAMDEAARAFEYSWFFERVLENLVEGLVIGLVVYWMSCLREKRIERRMREIGFLNHHIRNAMQTITLAATETADPQQRAAMIDMSISRVVETLARINRESDELNLESPAHPA